LTLAADTRSVRQHHDWHCAEVGDLTKEGIVASRSSHVIGGIHGLALGIILVVAFIILSGVPPVAWLIAIGLLAWGAWDIYRAAQGRKKDPETVADFERSISAVGGGSPPEGRSASSGDDAAQSSDGPTL
jgi:hypothetical protein